MDKTIVISGTDPGNPRCAGHIEERLAQMERDLAAMYGEAGRLWMFADSIRDVLREQQGRRDADAVDQAQAVKARIARLREYLGQATLSATGCRSAIASSGVNMRARFGSRSDR